MARYFVVGNLTVDDTVLADGTTAMGSLGGNALYSAIGARVWSDDLAIISRLGRGYPAELLARIETAGFALDGLIPTEHARIRQWQLYDVEGGRTYVRLPSAGTYQELSPGPEEVPGSLLAGFEACHVAPMHVDLQVPWIHWARDQRAQVMVDPHFDSVAGRASTWRKVLPLVDAFMPSKEEAKSLLGCWSGAERAVRELGSWGARVTCLKLGSEGAIIYEADADRLWHVPSVVDSAIDTTGCGDAFCGGFLVGWHESRNPYQAGLKGAVSASLVAAGFGAEHALTPNRAEAQRRLQEVAHDPNPR